MVQLVDDSLLVRKNGSFSYILGEQNGEDLIIKLTSGETFTVVDYFNSHVDSSSLQFTGMDNNGHKFTQSVSSYLVFEDPIVAELSSSNSNYEDLSGGMHVVMANESGEYNIKLGDSDKNVVYVVNGEYYEIELGNGNGNEVKIGDFEAETPLNAYAEVKVGNGDNNSIALFKTGSYTGVTVGDGEHNSIHIDAPYRFGEPVNTYAHIDIGHGDGNELYMNNNGTKVIQIGNGDNNNIYSHGTGQNIINSSDSEEFYYGENPDKIGSCYFDVGYNSGDTISTTYIRSFGNDTIKGVGTVNVNIDNPTTTTKVIQTNFGEREVTQKSQTIVSLGNGPTANIHIELQPKSQIGQYTKFFSLYSHSGSSSAYDFVYGAMDNAGNMIDGEIVINQAYVQNGSTGSGPGGSTPFKFRFDTGEGFFRISGSDYKWGLDNELQLYDMARMGTNDFIHNRDIVYNGGVGLLVNGTSENDRIDVYGGATVNAKGGINNIVSQGDNRINVTGTDNIYVTDYEDDDENIVPTHHTINVSTTGHANISNVMNATSTLIEYDKSVKNIMFSYYGDSEETFMSGTPNYLTIHTFDADGNMINSDKIYGYADENDYFEFDARDEHNNVLIDNHLTIKYNKDAFCNLSEMTRYFDMSKESMDHHFAVDDLPAYTLYLGAKGDYVQGSVEDDSYYYEWTKLTIKEVGGNDTLTIYADDGMLRGARNTKFIFDVSVTRDAETNEITYTMGDDIIFVSDFNVGGQIENFFSTNADTRDSVSTLTVKDYFKSGGTNMDNIRISYTQGANYYDIFNYDAFINNNEILESVTAWLGENTEYSSVMEAINSCGDQTKLNALCACYSANHLEYWTQQSV